MRWCCLPNSRDITRGVENFIQHAGEKSHMREVHGGADRSSRQNHYFANLVLDELPIWAMVVFHAEARNVIFHAEARKYMPDYALELIVHVLMLPRACAVCVRPAPHTRADGTR